MVLQQLPGLKMLTPCAPQGKGPNCTVMALLAMPRMQRKTVSLKSVLDEAVVTIKSQPWVCVSLVVSAIKRETYLQHCHTPRSHGCRCCHHAARGYELNCWPFSWIIVRAWPNSTQAWVLPDCFWKTKWGCHFTEIKTVCCQRWKFRLWSEDGNSGEHTPDTVKSVSAQCL